MWSIRTKPTEGCSSLFFPDFAVLSALIETTHSESAGLFISVWIRAAGCSNEWKHWPIWRRTVQTDCAAHLWGLLSLIHSKPTPLFLLLLLHLRHLFIPSGLQPRVTLLSHQITSPFAARGAGWLLVAGLNERNDQALCGSHSLPPPPQKK